MDTQKRVRVPILATERQSNAPFCRSTAQSWHAANDPTTAAFLAIRRHQFRASVSQERCGGKNESRKVLRKADCSPRIAPDQIRHGDAACTTNTKGAQKGETLGK